MQFCVYTFLTVKALHIFLCILFNTINYFVDFIYFTGKMLV